MLLIPLHFLKVGNQIGIKLMVIEPYFMESTLLCQREEALVRKLYVSLTYVDDSPFHRLPATEFHLTVKIYQEKNFQNWFLFKKRRA